MYVPFKKVHSSRSAATRSGAAAVEFAFACIPLFILIVASLEIGRAMMVLNYMTNAARVAVRYAIVQGTPSDGTNLTHIQTQATNTLAIAMVYTSTVNVYYYTPTSPSYTPPTLSTSWSNYPNSNSTYPVTNPTTNDFIRVNVQVNAKDVTWIPLFWFLGRNQTFSVSEDMVVG